MLMTQYRRGEGDGRWTIDLIGIDILELLQPAGAIAL
jgi:hypothetical protein